MEGLILIAVVLVLAFPVIAIVALVKALGAGDKLRRFEERLTLLEQRGLAAPPAAPAPIVAPTPAPEPVSVPVPPPPPAVAEPVPPPPPPAAVPASAAPEPTASFEERFGTRWVVWVGGLALALGGIFLVRYSIEQDLIGPGLRLFFAGLFAALLIAGGEWTRRQESLAGLATLPTAHIPGILTAAGTMVAYATAYAAYGIYDFLSPAVAFVLLGAVALATLAAALLHGPALAALGLVGAYVTPLLVASEKPDFWALYIYLAIVTAAAFALARFRLWQWLALTAVVFSFFWMLPGLEAARAIALGPHIFHAVAGFALAAGLIVAGLFYGPQAEPGKIDGVSSVAVVAYLFAACLLVLASLHDSAALWTFALLSVGTTAIAWRTDAAAAALPFAAAFVFLVIAEWALDTRIAQSVLASGPVQGLVPEPMRADVSAHLVFGAGFAILFGGAGFLAQGRSVNPVVAILWSAAGVLAPVAILVALYYRITGFEQSVPFAGLALLSALLYAFATEALGKRAPRPGSAASEAIFATGSIASLALALTFALEKGWLTVALALMVPGIAWISQKRPLPMLRWLAAALVVLVLARVGWEPRIVGSAVGTTPIFNWLLYGYGVPALSFWVAGHLLRRRADDVPARIVEAAAILFTVLLAVLEIRHYMTGGNIYRSRTGLAELALDVSGGLAMAIGLEHVRLRSGSIVHDIGAIVIAAGTLALIVFGLAFFENPMLTGDPVGGPFVNLILLGYGLPAILAIVLALRTRERRPMIYRATAAVTAVALALAYLSLEVRTLYHGSVLTSGFTSQVEQYTYSAVWLGFGVVLLVVGFYLRSQPARLASAAVLILTIAKVFLFDMSELVGIYRALSFIGLGLVLVGIGLLYQRLLFPKQANAAPPPAPPPPA